MRNYKCLSDEIVLSLKTEFKRFYKLDSEIELDNLFDSVEIERDGKFVIASKDDKFISFELFRLNDSYIFGRIGCGSNRTYGRFYPVVVDRDTNIVYTDIYKDVARLLETSEAVVQLSTIIDNTRHIDSSIPKEDLPYYKKLLETVHENDRTRLTFMSLEAICLKKVVDFICKNYTKFYLEGYMDLLFVCGADKKTAKRLLTVLTKRSNNLMNRFGYDESFVPNKEYVEKILLRDLSCQQVRDDFYTRLRI